MSITSVSSGMPSSVKPRIRSHGTSGNMCIHGIHGNVEQSLPDESPNPTARISFASDTNFNPKCKSRISRKAKTAAINIRPIKVGENTHVTKFQVPKATAPSFVHKHCSVTRADFDDSKDTPGHPDYSKIPHYICRSSSMLSEDNRFSDDVRRTMTILHGHSSAVQGHRSVIEGHCDTLVGHYGPSSDRTHVKLDSSLGKGRDDLRMLRTPNRFSCMNHYVSAKSALWTRPSTDTSNVQQFVPRRPIFRHIRDVRPHFSHGRSFHINNNESAKRLNHKFKCHECCKFRTSIQNLGWNGKQDALCDYYDGS